MAIQFQPVRGVRLQFSLLVALNFHFQRILTERVLSSGGDLGYFFSHVSFAELYEDLNFKLIVF
jgi:hypothetical protein